MSESGDDESDFMPQSEDDVYSTVSEDEGASGYASSASEVTNKYSEYSDDDFDFEPLDAVSCTDGALSRMNSLPLAVFPEIARHLHPLDILHISRTNRSWRDMLHSPTSRHIWTASLQTLRGLPRCPEDLSGAEYVAMLFEKKCTHCGTPAPAADFGLQVRLCVPCARGNVIGQKLLKSIYPHISADVLKLLPYTDKSPFGNHRDPRSHYYSDDPDDLNAQETAKPSKAKFYYLPAAEAMAVTLSDKKKTCDEMEVNDWMMEQERAAGRVLKHARNLGRWLKASTLGKSAGNAKKLRNRKIDITTRLLSLGHDDIDVGAVVSSYNFRSIVVQPKELTEQEWSHIGKGLEDGVLSAHQTRLQRERTTRISSRKKELLGLYEQVCPPRSVSAASACPRRPIYPTTEDFYHLPSVRVLWEERKEPITQADLPGLTVVVREMQELVNRMKKDVEDLLKKETGSTTAGAAGGSTLALPLQALHLATAVVYCSICSEPLHWPTLLTHDHVRHGNLNKYNGTVQWNVDLIRANRLYCALMRVTLRAAGLDERTATVEQLDRLGPLGGENKGGHMNCHYCLVPRAAMPWRRFFLHFKSEHADRAASVYFAISGMDSQEPNVVSMVRAGQPKSTAGQRINNASQPKNNKALLCRLCPQSTRTFESSGIVSHLKAKHGKEKDESEQYIIRPT